MALMGLDLSLRCSGIVVADRGWGGDWAKVRSWTFGVKLLSGACEMERIGRLRAIRDRILELVHDHKVDTAWIESYAWGAAQGKELGELGGVVKVALADAGVLVRISNQSSARKLLLGHVPRRGPDAKRAVHQALTIAGATFETEDESDAFCVLNWGMSEVGEQCFASLPW
jgi:Holliday junction resolvasome RuvABC endonuclease subunit